MSRKFAVPICIILTFGLGCMSADDIHILTNQVSTYHTSTDLKKKKPKIVILSKKIPMTFFFGKITIYDNTKKSELLAIFWHSNGYFSQRTSCILYFVIYMIQYRISVITVCLPPLCDTPGFCVGVRPGHQRSHVYRYGHLLRHRTLQTGAGQRLRTGGLETCQDMGVGH